MNILRGNTTKKKEKKKTEQTNHFWTIYNLSRFMRSVHCGLSIGIVQLTFDFLSAQNKIFSIKSNRLAPVTLYYYCLHKYKNYCLKHMLNHKPINVLLVSMSFCIALVHIFFSHLQPQGIAVINYSVMCVIVDCGEYKNK